MSREDLGSGRSNQKLRTRQDLLNAVRELLERGETPSVNRVAELARVSRATAYRFFPNVKSMLAEVTLDADVLTPDDLFPDGEGSAEDRAARAVRYVFDFAADNEAAFRIFLSAVLEEAQRAGEDSCAYLRGGRRQGLIKRALQGRLVGADSHAPETAGHGARAHDRYGGGAGDARRAGAGGEGRAGRGGVGHPHPRAGGPGPETGLTGRLSAGLHR